MSISVELDDRVADVRVTDASLEVRLRDGRRISAPLAWFPRLVSASVTQRANRQSAAAGHGIHWPEVDEDLSVAGLLRTSELS